MNFWTPRKEKKKNCTIYLIISKENSKKKIKKDKNKNLLKNYQGIDSYYVKNMKLNCRKNRLLKMKIM